MRLGSDYLKNLSRYLRHDDFIDGDVDAVRKYLVPHLSEESNAKVKLPDGTHVAMGSAAWKIRNDRLENKNLCEPILMQWLAYLTQKVTTTGLEGADWEQILGDIDGEGTPLTIFKRYLDWDYLGYGRVGVLVEGPAEVAENATDALLRGERAYAQKFEPWLILKADKFKNMGPKRGQLREVVLLVDSVEGENQKRNMLVRRLWIEEQGQNYRSQLLELKGHILDEVNGATGPISRDNPWHKPIDIVEEGEIVEGSFDKIPFVIFGDSPRLDSVIYTAVSANKSHMNKSSAKDTIDYYQSSQRVMFAGVDKEALKMWNESMALMTDNENAKLHVVAAGDPTSLSAGIERLERDALLDGLLRVAQRYQLMTAQTQSAESKREDNATFVNYLGYVVDVMQSGMTEVIELIYRFERNSEPRDMSVTIGKDFRIAATDEELTERALLMSWLREFGQPGREATGHLIATSLLEQRIAVFGDEGSAENLLQELANAIVEEAKREPTSARLRADRPRVGSIADRIVSGEQQRAQAA